jgi:DNA-binding transcriptional LysR family regulator
VGTTICSERSDLTAPEGLEAGTLQPVLLDWVGASSPPLNLLIRKAVSRQPRVRAVVDFLAEAAAELVRQRLPAGLRPVRPAQRPDWFKRRVGG